NIDGRLPGYRPCRRPDLCARRPKQLAVHTFSPREHLARFRPHPIVSDITGHQAPLQFGLIMCGRVRRIATAIQGDALGQPETAAPNAPWRPAILMARVTDGRPLKAN